MLAIDNGQKLDFLVWLLPPRPLECEGAGDYQEALGTWGGQMETRPPKRRGGAGEGQTTMREGQVVALSLDSMLQREALKCSARRDVSGLPSLQEKPQETGE